MTELILREVAFGLRWLTTFSRSALGLRGLKAIEIGVHTIVAWLVLEHYQRKTGEIFWAPIGNFKAHDGVSQSRAHSIEIKFETSVLTTFNLCIEIEYRGIPSGIEATLARKWVHCVPVDQTRVVCYEFETERLREQIQEYPVLTGGDNRNSKFKLLPLSQAEELKSDKFFVRIPWRNLRCYWS